MSPTCRFGNFEVDLTSGELRRGGVARPRLQEQPLIVLGALVEHDGAIVAREQLQGRLWPDGVHVDYQHGLNKAIQKLRSALGDSSESPRFIETIPRLGYRFVTPVEIVVDSGTPEEPPAASPTASTTASHHRAWRRWMLAAVALAILVLVASSELWRSGRQPDLPVPGTSASPGTLAILPFYALEGDEEGTLLGLGMADTLITKLSTLSSLTVRPTSSVLGFSGVKVDALELARGLAVDHVLEGTLQRRAGRVRVNLRLLEVASGRPLWAEVLEKPEDDLFALQDLVAEEVVAKLSLELSRSETSRLVKRHTNDLEAYEEYLRGRYLLERESPENLRKAIAALGRATELDPDFALAWAGIAEAYSPLLTWGWITNDEGLEPLRAAAHRAFELDANLAETQLAIAQAHSFDWDFAAEERAYQRAISLNPSYAKAYSWYGFLLSILGRDQEALTLQRRAWELDPTGLIPNINLAAALADNGQPEEAINRLERLLELEPEERWPMVLLGDIAAARGDFATAATWYEQTGELVARAAALARDGQPELARALLGALDATSDSPPPSAYERATLHASLGEADQAFALLEQVYRDRSWRIVGIRRDGALEPLRQDPRFASLVRRIGLDGNVESNS